MQFLTYLGAEAGKEASSLGMNEHKSKGHMQLWNGAATRHCLKCDRSFLMHFA
jgi:hypothetical protein